MAIYIVDGKPRHGKTSWLVNDHISQWLKDARNGWKVYSNIKIFVENIRWIRKLYKKPADCIGDILKKKDRENPQKLLYYWRNIDEWNFMSHGIIIADEATRYFNARQWQLLSPDTEIKLQQHGKEDLDIWGTTQHWSRLDASLRVICESFFRVERVFGWGNNTYVAKVSEHYLEELQRWEHDPVAFEAATGEGEEGGKPVHYEYFMPARLWGGRLFDTHEPVGTSRAMPLRHIERFCSDPHCKLHKKPKVSHL